VKIAIAAIMFVTGLAVIIFQPFSGEGYSDVPAEISGYYKIGSQEFELGPDSLVITSVASAIRANLHSDNQGLFVDTNRRVRIQESRGDLRLGINADRETLLRVAQTGAGGLFVHDRDGRRISIVKTCCGNPGDTDR
jgi:hypothetical protein